MKSVLLLVPGLLLGVSAAVYAENGPQQPKSFSELDADGNGELSRSEVSGDRFLSERFDELDTDGSGTLSESEMHPQGGPGGQGGPDGQSGQGGPGGQGGQGGPGGQPPSFSDLDTNGDGVISQDEAASDRFLQQMFSKLDKDGSGTLTEDELRMPPPPRN